MQKSKENINYTMPIQKCIDGEEIRKLSDLELLAVIIGSGTKNCDVMKLSLTLLQNFGGITGLYKSGLHEMAKTKGIGFKKAIKIHCSMEIGRRILSQKLPLNQISSPESVWKLFLPELACKAQEEFHVLILNNKNTLIKKSTVTIGTVSESLVHPREVFRDAIKEGGSAIIAVHNHPSESLNPSQEDIIATKRLVEAGKVIGINVHDHVIITRCGYYSFKESGYII